LATQDPFSTITFDHANVFTGRPGALLRENGSAGALWQPYLKGNVWWGSNGFDTFRFDDVSIQTGRNSGTHSLKQKPCLLAPAPESGILNPIRGRPGIKDTNIQVSVNV